MKRLVLFVLLSFITFSLFCGGREQHDAWMEQALFGGELRSVTVRKGSDLVTAQKPVIIDDFTPMGKEKLRVIENIVALCVDDFNRGQEKAYNSLVDYWSKNGVSFPPFNEIDYSDSPNEHEKPTHRGWEKWPKGKYGTKKKGNIGRRKQLFVDTIGCVFKTSNDEKLTNALCQYLNTLHVIGDIIEDSQKSSHSRLTITGVINELEECLPVILDNHQGKVTLHLEAIRAEVEVLTGAKEALDIPEEIYERSYKRLAGSSHKTEKNNKNVLNILYSYVPEILLDQSWFSDAFYYKPNELEELLAG